MWRVVELIVIIAFVLIFITEFFIPILTDKPLFGSFRKQTKKKDESNSKDDSNENNKSDN